MRIELAKFDKLQAINAKSRKHYQPLCALIEYFTQIGEPDIALSLCRKMVKAKYRDRYLQLIIASAISCAKYEEASACVKLFCDKTKNTAIFRLIQLVRGGKSQKIFEFLVDSNLAGDFTEAALLFGRKILGSAAAIAIPFLINHKVFSLSDRYSSFDYRLQAGPIKTLQELVLAKLLEEIMQLSGSQSLLAYLQKITIDKLGKNFENLIKQLLLQGKFEFAIEVTNFYHERRAESERFLYFSTFENESSVVKLFLQYFSENNMRLTKELLMTLSKVHPSVQADIIKVLWEKALPLKSDEQLLLLSVMGDIAFKCHKLVDFVVDQLSKDEFLLVNHAVRYFSGAEQAFWGQVIHHCREKQYNSLWQFLIEVKSDHYQLVELVIKQMILEKSAVELLRILLDIQRQLTSLSEIKFSDYNSEMARHQRAVSSIYQMTYKACYAEWSKMHLEPDYCLALFRGIQALLANSPVKISLYPPLVLQLTTILKNVVSLKYYDVLFEVLDCLKEQVSSRSYRDDFHSNNISLVSEVLKIFESLLKEGGVLSAEKLLSYVEKDSYRYTECIIKLAQYYFSQKDYQALENTFELLRSPHYMHDLYPIIKGWVIALIKENEIE